MSLEIQEWSHKSRSKINNLYLLTQPMYSTSPVIVCTVLQCMLSEILYYCQKKVTCLSRSVCLCLSLCEQDYSKVVNFRGSPLQ